MVFWIVTAVFALIPFLMAWMMAEEAQYEGGSPAARGIGGFFLGLLFGGILWAFIGLLGIGSLGHIGSTTQKTGTEVYNLTALETGNQVSGRFFLGSGTVNDNQVFSYLYQDEDGGFRLDSAYASNSVVYEDDSEKPRLEVDNYETVPNPWLSPILPIGGESTGENKFYVPEGSVLSNYQVTP